MLPWLYLRKSCKLVFMLKIYKTLHSLLSIQFGRKTISEMSGKIHLCVFLSLLALMSARPDRDLRNLADFGISHKIFDVPVNDTECNGSVTLYEGIEETVVTKDGDIKRVNVEKAVVEGCGCFTLHEKKKGKGKMIRLPRGEKTFQKNMKVKSVKKVDCAEYEE